MAQKMKTSDINDKIQAILDQTRESAMKTLAPYIIEVTIDGTSALLQHKYPDSSKNLNPYEDKTGLPPEPDYMEHAWLHNGLICEPADHMQTAIGLQAKEQRIPGRGARTYGKLARATVKVMPDLIPHKYQEVERHTRLEADKEHRKRPVSYPLMQKWSLTFYIAITHKQMPPLSIKKALEDAGALQGIGRHREKGQGRFTLVSWKQLR